MMRTKVVFFGLLFSAFVTVSADAATYTAVSCKESDVQAAYSVERATPADGDIIAIPAGTCTWTTTWTLSPSNSITFQGAGAIVPSSSCTFAPGSACTTTEGTDQTVITDGTSAGNIMFHAILAVGKTFRLTGIEYIFPLANPNTGSDGQWQWSNVGEGGTSLLRIDHNHFYVYGGHIVELAGWGPFGVADHNLVDMFAPDNIWIYFGNGIGWNNDNLSYGNGNGSWADYSYWGSSKAFFVENNVFPDDESNYGVYVNDCSNGGRQVMRYNTFESPSNGIQAHEGGSDNRGCRTTEVYGNTSIGVADGVLAGSRSGSALIWGNVGSWQRIFTPSVDRTNIVNGTFNPKNLGLCGQGASGTATSSGSTVTWVSGEGGVTFFTNWPDISTRNMVFNGTSYPIASCSSTSSCTLTGLTGSNGSPVPWYAPSVWDQNTNSRGYACYDQPGRGKGDLIVGNFSNQTRKDSVTNTPTWPNEAIDPNYVFDNTNSYSGGVCVAIDSSDTNTLVDNRDFYQQFGTGCESGSFNGTKGVGQGLYSAIPSTCTAGPGGNTPGVGYWATDQSTLYVCTATNTWTSYYTPYTYPHPLTQGDSNPPAPPSNLSATVQ